MTSHPVLLEQHGVELDAVNDVVELTLATSIDGLRNGAVKNVDRRSADAVDAVFGHGLGL